MGTQIQVITPWLCIETHGDDWGSPCVSIACHSYNFPGLNPISVSCRATICWMKAAKFIIPTAFCFCSCVSAWHQQLLWATSKHTHTHAKKESCDCTCEPFYALPDLYRNIFSASHGDPNQPHCLIPLLNFDASTDACVTGDPGPSAIRNPGKSQTRTQSNMWTAVDWIRWQFTIRASCLAQDFNFTDFTDFDSGPRPVHI